MAGDQFARLGTHNMVLPPEGPKVYGFTLDFTSTNTREVDMTGEIEKKFITFVQALLIDNRLNAQPLIVAAAQIGFEYSIPAGKQAYMPIFITDAAVLTFRTPQAASLVVPIVVTNTPVQPYVW